jgi:probable addiction module antidote protein
MPTALSKYPGHPHKIVAHLNHALEQEDRAAFPIALMEVVRAHSISAVSERTGLRRETIHRPLSGKQKPTFYLVVKILAALGAKIVIRRTTKNPSGGRVRTG